MMLNLFVLALILANSLSSQNDTQVSTPKSKFVKLTMKQGLLMNQVLSVFAVDKTTSPQCRNHSLEFKNGLRALQPWALQMFDSSSKLQSGILNGNVMEFGMYQQCLNVHFKDLHGKHCLFRIVPSLKLIKTILKFRNISEQRFPKIKMMVETTALYWSVCVPESCPAEDILKHFEKTILEMSEGLNLTVTLSPESCVSRKDEPTLGTTQYIVLGFLGSFIVIVLLCTALHCVGKHDNPNEWIDNFSIISNYNRITAKGRTTNLDCLHGVRFLSTCYVVIGHRYFMAMLFPIVNGFEVMNWVLKYTSTVIIGGTVCVDTFFIISGILVSIGFFEVVTKTNKFNVLFFYAYRYLRLTPALAITVLVYATLIQFLGSGPLWFYTYMAIQKPCIDYWWSSLLYVQNYVNPHSYCIVQTWSLTCDMLFYYFSPIILYPLWKSPTMGLFIAVILYLCTVSINFYLAWLNEFEGGMPITNQLINHDYVIHHYTAPHNRAAPYIMGLGFGYLCFKSNSQKRKISSSVQIAGWILTAFTMLSVLLICHIFQIESHEYNRLGASLYLSLSRSAWSMGVIWIIWICVNGYGGVVNYILTMPCFKILGRISYGIFLFHLMFQFLKGGANKLPEYFSDFIALYDGLADIFVMIIFGFFFSLFYEQPLIGIPRIILQTSRKIEPQTKQSK